MKEHAGGKLSTEELIEYVLSARSRRRPEVLVSAEVGEDCAVLDHSGPLLVTGDPITGAAENAGSLAIYVSSNDVAAAGGEAIAAFLTVIVPPGTPLTEIQAVMKDAERAAEGLNIEIAGGHTEFSDAVTRTIVSCTMLGKPRGKRVFSGANVKPGDAILLTGAAGREFAAISASDFPAQAAEVLTEEECREARALAGKLSIVREAVIAAELPGTTAMHDVTEGGVLGALSEILHRAGCGAAVDASAIPVDEVTRKLCRAFHKDPLQVISSGNLLVFTRAAEETLARFAAAGIEAAHIGTVTRERGISLKGESK